MKPAAPATTSAIACLVLIGLLPLLPASTQALLRFERAALLQGEYWRLLSGPLLHADLLHACANGVGLVLLLVLARRSNLPVTPWLLPGLCVGSSVLLLLDSTVSWMVGLSGPLHGLAAWLLIALYRHGQRATALMLLTLLLGKVWLELSQTLPAPTWLSVPLLPEAHVAGLLAGLLMGAAGTALNHLFRLFRPPAQCAARPQP
ncbi:rhombosortase [Chitinimonas sp. BJYL2]|uniref:rhombosortase n=1 Tax=Chitinimonas sp. BJYL2 TaxID=2976696 RepID=UPI0022B2E481|nr:rhombosortase [Chitinimonas sp. BJYL2]